MAMVELKNIRKKLGGVDILNGVDLSVEEGEVVVILGPSGSGKTTLLRTINFLGPADAGTITVDGLTVDSQKHHHKETLALRRKTGMVFQNYNLFRNKTVLQNITEGLTTVRKIPHEQAVETAMALLKKMNLENRASAYPAQLSGGQQQRIAIARAIVNEPKVLLLDEPLGALDLKLRQDMQYELIRLKNELGITFVYVTHDQEEALTMSDTIVVMNQGYIQQIGTPEDIYNEPQNAFVADFIGDSNILDGIMIEDRLVEILGAKFECVDVGFGKNKPVDVVIRPEDIDLVKPEEGTIRGRVTHLIFKGVHYEMEVTVNGFELLVHSTDLFPVGQEVGIHVDPFDIQIMNKPESEDEEAAAIEE